MAQMVGRMRRSEDPSIIHLTDVNEASEDQWRSFQRWRESSYEKCLLTNAFDLVDRSLINVEHSGERKIYGTTWDAYISQLSNATDVEIIEQVESKTVYVDWERFIKLLEHSFTDFVREIGDQPFYIYLPTNKFGSEYVLVAWLWQDIKKLNFQGFVSLNDNSMLKDDANVLIIDDAIYSGHNLMGSIDELMYTTRLKFNFYIVVACSSLENLGQVEFPDVKIRLFNSLLVPRIPTEGTSYEQYMDELVPMYFDHKIAGKASTFTDVYTELLPYPPDDSAKYKLYETYFATLVSPPANTYEEFIM